MTRRSASGALTSARPDRQASILQPRAKRVRDVVDASVGVQPPASLRPGQRVGSRYAMVYLQHPAVEDAVLGPRTREVLHAADLDVGDVAGGGEPPRAGAMRMPRELAGDVGRRGDHVDEPFRRIGVETEVGRLAFGRARRPWMVMAED